MEITLANGYKATNLTKESFATLVFLINNVELANNFVFDFLVNSQNENIAVNDFRLHMIESDYFPRNEFVNEFKDNMKNALERLFMCPIGKHELTMLENKINSNRITAEELFNKHYNNKRYKLLRLLN